jgi:DNA-binding Lrp family transcriptional regulator
MESATAEVHGIGSVLNGDLAQMVKQITEIGPRVPEIARRLRRHKETVRYWYEKLEEHDFAIQGMVNHEALGLRRVILKVQVEKANEASMRALMTEMNEHFYVVSYAKTLPEEIYILNASVPEEFVAEFIGFAEELERQGVFKRLDFYVFDWVRNLPMRAEFFDFETGRWNLDLAAMSEEDRGAAAAQTSEPPVSSRVKFDKIDLLLAKELQRDATRELQEIQQSIKAEDKVDVNYKTLSWHLKERVKGMGLLKGYRLNWVGSRWNPTTDRAKNRSHSIVFVNLFVKAPTPEQRAELMNRMRDFPLLWAEGAGPDYFAEVAIPTELLIEGLEYLRFVMNPVRENASYHIIDQRQGATFPISYQLFDEDSKRWTFNKDKRLASLPGIEARVKGA